MSTNFYPIKRITTSKAVVQQVLELISKGMLGPGDKLPPEQELTAQLEVSRASVREAIGSLSLVGLVVTRHGQGAYITEELSDFIDTLAGWSVLVGESDIAKLMEVRQPLEVLAAGLAAERATPDDIATRRQSLIDLENSADDIEEQVKADLHFHRLISQASYNPVLHRIMRSLRGLMERSIVETTLAASKFGMTPQTVDVHYEILDAIECGNPELARQATEKHMTLTQNTWEIIISKRSIEETSSNEDNAMEGGKNI